MFENVLFDDTVLEMRERLEKVTKESQANEASLIQKVNLNCTEGKFLES